MTPMRNPLNDGARDRFTERYIPEHINCSCERRVSIDDVVICPECDKVLCDECASELEWEIGCCEECLPKHVSKLKRRRDDALAGDRVAREDARRWQRRHASMATLAVVLLVVIALMGWWAGGGSGGMGP